jgi:hypothetical protein
VGKSKLIERYLMDDYNPTQLSTYALNTFRKRAVVHGKEVRSGTFRKRAMVKSKEAGHE